MGVQWRMLLVSLLLVLLTMEVGGSYLLTSLNRYYLTSFTANLSTQAALLGSVLEPNLAHPSSTLDLSPQIAQFGAVGGQTVVVVNSQAVVVGTSGALQSEIGSRLNSPLVADALRGKRVSGYTHQGGQPVAEVALPVIAQGHLVGAVLMTALLTPVVAAITNIRQILFLATAFSLMLAVIAGILLSRLMAGPIRRLAGRVRRVGSGQFDPPPDRGWPDDDLGQLGRAFDEMTLTLQATLETIGREREKLEAVLYNIRDGVVALGPDGQVLFSNPAAETLLGRTAAELAGLELLTAQVTGARLANWTDQGEERVLRVEGRPAAALGAWVVTIQDVTEEASLNEMRRRFVADVGHELKTPLTSLKSYLETLSSEKALRPTLRRRFVGVALSETDRMVRLVQDLLTLSQADSQQLGLGQEHVAVEELVGRAVTAVGPQATERGVTIERTLPDPPLEVAGDLNRLTQVLVNVLQNAIAYSPQGGVVTLGVRPTGGQVEITVADRGPGIPLSSLAHVFERFYRVDSARSRDVGGTGLGLSIAKEIVLAHGGQIKITNRKDGGARVRITLPAASAAQAAGGGR